MFRRAMLFVPLACTPALAQFDHGDVAVNLVEGRIVLGVHDESSPLGLAEDCVFESDLGPALSAEEPGFESPPGVFAPGASAGLDILGAVQRWDGVSFVATTTRLGVGYGPLTENLSPADGSVSPGAGWASVNAEGELHQHWTFALVEDEGPGVYLARLRLFVGAGESDPFWLLLGTQTTEIEAAEDYVRTNLAACAPASVADTTTTSANPGDAGYGVPDGVVNGADLSFYVERWLTMDAPRADVNTRNVNPGEPGYGEPDGLVDGADLSYFVETWLGAVG